MFGRSASKRRDVSVAVMPGTYRLGSSDADAMLRQVVSMREHERQRLTQIDNDFLMAS